MHFLRVCYPEILNYTGKFESYHLRNIHISDSFEFFFHMHVQPYNH